MRPAILLCLFAGAAAQQFTTAPEKCALEVCFAGDEEGSTALAARVLAAVEGAERSLWMWAYSLSDPALLAALERRAGEPDFDLRILLDAEQLDRLLADEADAEAVILRGLEEGGKIVRCSPPDGRQHIKLMLIDDGLIIAGSKNWSDLAGTSKWNDLILLADAKGDLVKPLRGAFVEASGEAFPEPPRFKKSKLAGDDAEDIRALLGMTAPGEEDPAIRRELLGLLTLARERIHLALFVCNDLELLELVASRAAEGVDVRVLLDRVQAENLSYRRDKTAERLRTLIEQLQEQGCLRLVGDRQLHHKFALIDDVVATGSANWSKAAWEKNHEVLFLLSPRRQADFPDRYAARHAAIWAANGD